MKKRKKGARSGGRPDRVSPRVPRSRASAPKGKNAESGNADPEREAVALSSLNHALIDASTLILSAKAGFLPALSRSIQLTTLQSVVEESGIPVRDVLDDRSAGTMTEPDDARTREALGPTDAAIISVARSRRLSVLTEDRKLSLRLEAFGLPYYNACTVLLALLMRGEIDPEMYDAFRDSLLAHTHYSARMLKFCDAVYLEVLKRR